MPHETRRTTSQAWTQDSDHTTFSSSRYKLLVWGQQRCRRIGCGCLVGMRSWPRLSCLSAVCPPTGSHISASVPWPGATVEFFFVTCRICERLQQNHRQCFPGRWIMVLIVCIIRNLFKITLINGDLSKAHREWTDQVNAGGKRT